MMPSREYLAKPLTPYPLPTKDRGILLRTIDDVRTYMLALPKNRALGAHWQPPVSSSLRRPTAVRPAVTPRSMLGLCGPARPDDPRRGQPVGRIDEDTLASSAAELRWFWSITVCVNPKAGIFTSGKRWRHSTKPKSSSRQPGGAGWSGRNSASGRARTMNPAALPAAYLE